jgi:hypothetical protein
MYVLPVLIIVVWISIKAIIDRRREGAGGPTPPDEPHAPV